MKISLKALRVNADMNQAEAAKKLAVTEKTIQNWEAHRTFPSAGQLVSICRISRMAISFIAILPDAVSLALESARLQLCR